MLYTPSRLEEVKMVVSGTNDWEEGGPGTDTHFQQKWQVYNHKNRKFAAG